MKAIVRAFGVARSNLLEQLRKQREPVEAQPAATTSDDAEGEETGANAVLLSCIRELVEARPSYGYRRVTALLNRELSERVNPKRIYRIMKRNKLLLERCTGNGRGRKHDGVIITLKPNLRWCSDSFEIRCWSGERVHVAFVLDCCDRELRELWSLKQALNRFYGILGHARVKRALLALLDQMRPSTLPEVQTLRNTLSRWRRELLAYFVSQRLTNARTEGFNGKAKLVIRRAYGYKSFRNYRLRLLNSCA